MKRIEIIHESLDVIYCEVDFCFANDDNAVADVA